MAKLATLAHVRTLARLYADSGRVGTPTITNTEVDLLINSVLGEFYDLLVSARGHEYYLTEDTSLTTSPGTALYNTAAYQMVSVALNWGTNRLEEVPALNNLGDRSRLTNWAQWGEHSPKAFRMRGSSIEFFPTPTSAVQVVQRYVPPFTDLQDIGPPFSTFDGVNGWEKLIALKVAIEMRTIEGQPITYLTKLYELEKERIENMAADLAANHPVQIRDVDPEGNGLDPWLRLPRATL